MSDASEKANFPSCRVAVGMMLGEACPDCDHVVSVHRVSDRICSVCESLDAPPESPEQKWPFDPREDKWIFKSYYKYTFTFGALHHPNWRMTYGGDSSQTYRYDVKNEVMDWNDASDNCCQSDDAVQSVFDGDHEYIHMYEEPS